MFLLGIKGLGNGFSLLGGDLLDNIFQATENPFLGLIVGVLTTSMVQSSSVTTSLIVGSGPYHCDSSLTTPPCSEGVKWYVRKMPTQLSMDQIAAFTAIYDHNNRPVQTLNERTLYRDDNPNVSVH